MANKEAGDSERFWSCQMTISLGNRQPATIAFILSSVRSLQAETLSFVSQRHPAAIALNQSSVTLSVL